MRLSQIRLAGLALVTGVALGGCAYGYDPYGGGYGGVSVGYGSGYGYGYGNPYGYGGYGGYPYGYAGYGYGGYDPFGWYGDFYYPGSGIYVYDRHHHRRVMTDRERTFWTTVIRRTHEGSTTANVAATNRVAPRENWSGFNRVRTQNSDPATPTSDNRRHWQSRSSVATPSDNDPATQARPEGRGHHRDRSNNP